MKKRIIYNLLLLFAMLFIDQITKYATVLYLQLGESIVIIPHFFNITYVRNYGAVFGFLNDSNTTWQFWLFMLAILFACVFVWFTLRANKNNTLIWLACVCILSGGFGNSVDRLRYRYVVDFFDFYIQSYHWPAFNFADCYILLGIFLLLFEPYATKLINKRQEYRVKNV